MTKRSAFRWGGLLLAVLGLVCLVAALRAPLAGWWTGEPYYEDQPLSYWVRQLRDTDQREGKCGVCEYRNLCGGSRARAFALTGDYLAEDPRCVYQPGHTKKNGCCGDKECVGDGCRA